MKKIPPDAFDFYFTLGPGRSYQAVADRYGVTKRAVTNLAKREDWQRRLVEIEAKAREDADQKNAQTLKAIHERQLQSLRLVQRRAIERLRDTPMETASEAARSLSQAIKQENVILGEPGDRTAVSVEDTIKREYERWMTTTDEDPGTCSLRPRGTWRGWLRVRCGEVTPLAAEVKRPSPAFRSPWPCCRS